MAAASILDFQNFELLTVERVTSDELLHLPIFVEIARKAAEMCKF